MAREIKFRVWDTLEKEMLFPDTITPSIIHLQQAVLMEFTGLIDKTGKDLYEGDVVNFAVKETWCDCKADIKFSVLDKFCPSCGKPLTARDFVRIAKIEYKKAAFHLAYYEPKHDSSYTWGFLCR